MAAEEVEMFSVSDMLDAAEVRGESGMRQCRVLMIQGHQFIDVRDADYDFRVNLTALNWKWTLWGFWVEVAIAGWMQQMKRFIDNEHGERPITSAWLEWVLQSDEDNEEEEIS
jgi:GT2 family glycosyltransferase